MNYSNKINRRFVVCLLFNYVVLFRLTFNSTCFFNREWCFKKHLCKKFLKKYDFRCATTSFFFERSRERNKIIFVVDVIDDFNINVLLFVIFLIFLLFHFIWWNIEWMRNFVFFNKFREIDEFCYFFSIVVFLFVIFFI